MAQKRRYFGYLSEIGSNTSIPISRSAIRAGCHCPMHTALACACRMEGVFSLVVGMPECTYYSRFVTDSLRGSRQEQHYTYVLDSNEVVFGCRKGLTKALYHILEQGAEHIAIIVTCIPALIGEDIEAVAEEIMGETGSKLVCMDLSHYKRNGYEAGYYAMADALYAFSDTGIYHTGQQINILGPWGGQEGRRLEVLWTAHGYSLNKLGGAVGREQRRSLRQAHLNIVTSLHYLPLAIRMERELKRPFVYLGEYISARLMRERYQKIAMILSVADSCADENYRECTSLEERCRKEWEGNSFGVSMILPEVLNLTAYLVSLSLKPVFLHLEEYTSLMKPWKEEILSGSMNPMIAYLVDPGDVQEHLAYSGMSIPGLWIGNVDPGVFGRVISEEEWRPLTCLVGYERIMSLMKLLKKRMGGEEECP